MSNPKDKISEACTLVLLQVTWAVKTTVAEVLGSQYVVPPPLALAEHLQLPAPSRTPAPPPTRHPPPLLLVTSAGVDPLEEVRMLGVPITSVSLGQGQVGVLRGEGRHPHG